MDQIEEAVSQPVSKFIKDSSRLLTKCSKPDRAELLKIAGATAVGFLIMGLIGFVVKLVHVPINNVLLS